MVSYKHIITTTQALDNVRFFFLCLCKIRKWYSNL